MKDKIKQAVINLKHNGELDKIIKHCANKVENKFLKAIRDIEDKDIENIPMPMLIFNPDNNKEFLQSILCELLEMEIKENGK